MTKTEYLNELKKNLSPLSETERLDILADFEEHFTYALSNGKTEEEICNDLGDPKENAEQYVNSLENKQAEEVSVIPVAAKEKQNEAHTIPNNIPSQNSNNSTKAALFLTGFIIALMFAISIYMSCVPTAAGGLILIVLGFSLIPLFNWQLVCLIISAGALITSASILFMLLITWLCKYLFKGYKKNNSEVN